MHLAQPITTSDLVKCERCGKYRFILFRNKEGLLFVCESCGMGQKEVSKE